MMNKFIVTACRYPAINNTPTCYVVEAESEDDAILIVKDETRDLSGRGIFDYKVKNYTPPPAGKIISIYR